MLPADWRAQLVEVIRRAEPADPAWFTGGPALGPLEQIGVYQEQYELRTGDAVKEDVPGLGHLLGDEADAVIAAYIDAFPPDAWTLNRIHARLPGFLRDWGRSPAEVEMAELEWAVSSAFEAADAPALRPEELAGVPRLRLAPAVRLLRLRWSVHRLRSALLLDEPLPALIEGDFPLVLCRPELQVRHLEIHPVAWELLGAIGAGKHLAEALATAAAGVDPAWLAREIPGWFQLFVERRVLVAG